MLGFDVWDHLLQELFDGVVAWYKRKKMKAKWSFKALIKYSKGHWIFWQFSFLPEECIDRLTCFLCIRCYKITDIGENLETIFWVWAKCIVSMLFVLFSNENRMKFTLTLCFCNVSEFLNKSNINPLLNSTYILVWISVTFPDFHRSPHYNSASCSLTNLLERPK